MTAQYRYIEYDEYVPPGINRNIVLREDVAIGIHKEKYMRARREGRWFGPLPLDKDLLDEFMIVNWAWYVK